MFHICLPMAVKVCRFAVFINIWGVQTARIFQVIRSGRFMDVGIGTEPGYFGFPSGYRLRK